MRLLIIFFCLLLGNSINAQSNEKTPIETLKEGVLAVRLPSNNKKILAIEKMLENTKSEKEIKRLQKLRQETIDERDRTRKYMMQYFNTDYSFSQVVFFYDTAITKLAQGHPNDIFLNENGNIDKNISVTNKQILILNYGANTDPSTSSGVSGASITDSKLKLVPAPFPNFVSITGIRLGWYKLNRSTATEALIARRLAKKINQKFKDFYNDKHQKL
ncbi:MAG: hypothetical protein KA974_10455 [Saprospiraceae bacterium]|nr:hypothetical protein [Saprospiraceae bacterium]